MVQSVQLFELAAQQAKWLAARQSAVAGNIANANTPGYGAVDIAPFEQVLKNSATRVSATAPGHIPIGGVAADYSPRSDRSPSSAATSNSVKLEDELIKAGEVRRAYELNTAIVKAFHRMMMMNAR
jgi:flagellar basal-body rod protein FlgB